MELSTNASFTIAMFLAASSGFIFVIFVGVGTMVITECYKEEYVDKDEA